MQELAPGIMLFDDVFINSMDYIRAIEENEISWREAEVLVNEEENVSGSNYKARDTDLIMLPHHEWDQDGVLSDMTKAFHEEMVKCLNQYKDFYYAKTQKFESPQLLRYGPEQKFHDHVDDHPFFTRRISMTYYLNEDYEGGDVEFPRFNLRFKAKKNQLLVFPSNFIYNHQVHPVISGLRYVIVQWMA